MGSRRIFPRRRRDLFPGAVRWGSEPTPPFSLADTVLLGTLPVQHPMLALRYE